MDSHLKIQPLGFPWQTADPFLFCAYHSDKYPAGNASQGIDSNLLQSRQLGQDFDPAADWRMYHGKTVPGFPSHPHRGFETISIVTRGLVDHADSLGAAGRFGNGDVQWMTAGRGVQHSEMFPLLDPEDENPLEMFQIWLNLPAKSKMAAPHFSMIWAEDIPEKTYADQHGKKTRVKLITGQYAELAASPPPPDSWAADPSNQVNILLLELAPGAEFTLQGNKQLAEDGVSRKLYFYAGDTLEIEHKTVPAAHSITVEAGQSPVIKNGEETARLLMLEGKPINEPVASYGPFVMNNRQEINQAMEEYGRTAFGGWPWPSPDHTHGNRDTGRFARFADGKEVKK